jgi:hypothetical protein
MSDPRNMYSQPRLDYDLEVAFSQDHNLKDHGADDDFDGQAANTGNLSETHSTENGDSSMGFIDHDAEWASSMNTSIVTTRAEAVIDQAENIQAVMQTVEFDCLLVAAKELSKRESISREEATDRLVKAFRSLDGAWKSYLIKRGIEAISGK